MAELANKDGEFWEGLKNWEVIVLVEAWVDTKEWKEVKGKLSRGYEWRVQLAGKKNKKGRAMKGMIMGIKREILEKGEKIEMEKEEKIVGRIRKSEQK